MRKVSCLLTLAICLLGPGRLPAQAIKEKRSIFQDKLLLGFALSPNGKVLACAYQNKDRTTTELRFWDVETGREKEMPQEVKLSGGPADRVLHTVPWGFTPDGSGLIVAGRIPVGKSDDADVALVDLVGGKPPRKLHDDPDVRFGLAVRPFALSPDGKLLAFTSTSKLWVVDLEAGKSRSILEDSNLAVVAFAPTGELLLVAKKLAALEDRGSANVKVLEASSGKQLAAVPGPFTPRGGAFLSDGKAFAVGGTENVKVPRPGQPMGVVRFWDAQTFKPRGELACHQEQMLSLAFTHGGRVMVSIGDGPSSRPPLKTAQLRLWDATTRRELAGISDLSGKVLLGGLDLSADGKVLALRGLKGDGQNKGEVLIWDASAAVKGIKPPGK
jgi:WD40 repeat protein